MIYKYFKFGLLYVITNMPLNYIPTARCVSRKQKFIFIAAGVQ